MMIFIQSVCALGGLAALCLIVGALFARRS